MAAQYPNIVSRAVTGTSAAVLVASDIADSYASLLIQADPANTQNVWIKFGTAAISDGICLVPGASITKKIGRGRGSPSDLQAISVSGTQRLNLSLS